MGKSKYEGIEIQGLDSIDLTCSRQVKLLTFRDGFKNIIICLSHESFGRMQLEIEQGVIISK